MTKQVRTNMKTNDVIMLLKITADEIRESKDMTYKVVQRLQSITLTDTDLKIGMFDDSIHVCCTDGSEKYLNALYDGGVTTVFSMFVCVPHGCESEIIPKHRDNFIRKIGEYYSREVTRAEEKEDAARRSKDAYRAMIDNLSDICIVFHDIRVEGQPVETRKKIEDYPMASKVDVAETDEKITLNQNRIDVVDFTNRASDYKGS